MKQKQTPLNTPLRRDEEWIAKQLRSLGVNAEVMAYEEPTADGSILVGRRVSDSVRCLFVQVGSDYVGLNEWDEAEGVSYDYGLYRTVQTLAQAIRGWEAKGSRIWNGSESKFHGLLKTKEMAK